MACSDTCKDIILYDCYMHMCVSVCECSVCAIIPHNGYIYLIMSTYVTITLYTDQEKPFKNWNVICT